MPGHFSWELPHIRGDELSEALQREAKARYVHRYTVDHVPTWARTTRPDGTPYFVQFASDADWLAHTWFNVTKDGRLANRSCWSCPTWPKRET
jgi:hypothetical protein